MHSKCITSCRCCLQFVLLLIALAHGNVLVFNKLGLVELYSTRFISGVGSDKASYNCFQCGPPTMQLYQSTTTQYQDAEKSEQFLSRTAQSAPLSREPPPRSVSAAAPSSSCLDVSSAPAETQHDHLLKIIWEQATSTPWWHTRWYTPCTIVQSYLPGGANVHGHLIHDSVGPPHSPSKTVARGSDQSEWPNSLVAIEATANYAASQKWGQMGWGEVIWGEMISVIL